MSYPSSEQYPSGQEPSHWSPDGHTTPPNVPPGAPPPPPPADDMSMPGYGTPTPGYGGMPMDQGANMYGAGGIPGGMYGYPVAPYIPDAPYSDAALWLGIISLASLIIFPFGILLAPLAMIFGFVGRSKVKQAPPNSYQTGKLTAGWILGMIGTVLLVLIIIGLALLIRALSSMDIEG